MLDLHLGTFLRIIIVTTKLVLFLYMSKKDNDIPGTHLCGGGQISRGLSVLNWSSKF